MSIYFLSSSVKWIALCHDYSYQVKLFLGELNIMFNPKTVWKIIIYWVIGRQLFLHMEVEGVHTCTKRICWKSIHIRILISERFWPFLLNDTQRNMKFLDHVIKNMEIDSYAFVYHYDMVSISKMSFPKLDILKAFTNCSATDAIFGTSVFEPEKKGHKLVFSTN